MTEKTKERKNRKGYVVPCMEIHMAEFHPLLGISPQGDHMQGRDMSDEGGDHMRGIDKSADTGAGAKAMILGQEFSFSDIWEE